MALRVPRGLVACVARVAGVAGAQSALLVLLTLAVLAQRPAVLLNLPVVVGKPKRPVRPLDGSGDGVGEQRAAGCVHSMLDRGAKKLQRDSSANAAPARSRTRPGGADPFCRVIDYPPAVPFSL